MKGLARLSLLAGILALAPYAWSQDEGASSFLKQAAEGNLAEVELAEVAQERAARPEVKEYAQNLEREHEKTNEKLKSIAEQKDVELPDEPGQTHEQLKEQLSDLQGQAFDQAYLKTMVQEHQKTIQSFEQQAKTAQDPEIKQFAEQTLPTLRAHLKQAEQLQKQSGG